MRILSTLILIFAALCFLSNCSDNSVMSEDSRIHFTIKNTDYSKNHFFLDEVYCDTSLNIFRNYFQNDPSVINQYYVVKEIDLWNSYTGFMNLEERIIEGFIELKGISINETYSQSYIDELPTQYGEVYKGRFMRLTENVDFILHKETGFVSITNSMIENSSLVVTFRIEGQSPLDSDDIVFGVFNPSSTNWNEPSIMKLIKTPETSSFSQKAWKLQLKNIYNVGHSNVNPNDFELNLYFVDNDGKVKDNYEGYNLLSLFGFDKYLGSGLLGEDGKFDFRPGKTVIPQTGSIIFSSLQPFAANLPEIFFNSSDSAQIYFDNLYTRDGYHYNNYRERNIFYLEGKLSVE